MICPCQKLQDNAKTYAQCCQPFHEGKQVPTAKQLMASRFSAFALGLAGYLKATWHSSTCPPQLDSTPDEQWLKLDIIAFTADTVHFKAYFKEGSDFKYLEESSNFILENNKLVYLNGKTNIGIVNLGRNNTCLCGSGKKYKKCCSLN